MAGFKPVNENDADIFLKLYQKYLFIKIEEMKDALEKLPADVIERCFNGAEFFENAFDISKLDEAQFGVGGLYGWNKVHEVYQQLEYYSYLQRNEMLVENLAAFGHKVNLKKIGVRKNE